MKKSIIILIMLCASIAIGTYLFTNIKQDKVETIPKQTKIVLKNIEQEKVSHKVLMETLNTQKVSLQKQLIQHKLDLKKSTSRNQDLTNQIKQLKSAVQEKPRRDTLQTLLICDSLADSLDSLFVHNEIRDNFFAVQTNMYDSLVHLQEQQLNVLSSSHALCNRHLDTLLSSNQVLQKQLNTNKRKFRFTKLGNRLLASVFTVSCIALYLKLKNNN